MYFKSTLIGTVIIIEVSPGLIDVQSDSISALTIIKDHVSTEAAKGKIQFDMETQMNEEASVLHVL